MDFVTTAIIAVVVPLAIGLLNKSAKRPAVTVDGRTEVAYGWGFKGFAVFSALVAVAPLVGMFFVPPDARVPKLTIALIFGIPAAYLVLEGFFVRIRYSDEGIEARSPWRRNRFVPWRDVRRVTFSGGAQWHRIETARSGYLRVHAMKSGVDTLLRELKDRGIKNY